MSYQALYRKWRPSRFDDVCGQEHITETLKKQIINNKIGHAYLFTGTRGTGKTTCAKIMAKAINCLNPQNGEPCGECENCKMAENDTLYDIVEIDAASKSKVEDVRRLIEEVIFAPSVGKYKVYIIDEVHMMTGNAFNALLKTLEEPPAHTVFILATTEVQKIPATIMSRCQRFDFKRLSVDIISDRLKYISEKDSINLTDEAADYLAVLADGALRDGLSLLEQCQTYEKITADTVREIVGLAGIDDICSIISAASHFDHSSVLNTVNKLYLESKKMENLIIEVMEACRDILLISLGSGSIVARTDSEKEKLVNAAKSVEKDTLLYWIDILADALGKTAKNTGNKTVTEIAFIKMCNPTLSNDLSAIIARLEKLENGAVTVVNTNTNKVTDAIPSDIPEPIIAQIPPMEEEPPVEDAPFIDESPKIEEESPVDIYSQLKDKLNSTPETMSLAAFLPDKYELKSDVLTFFASNFNYTFLNTPANISKLQQSVSAILNKNITVKISKGE